MNQPVALLHLLEQIPDPRSNQGKRHELEELLLIAVIAVLCGAEDWTGIELFAKSREDFFRNLLTLPHGLPSDDTYRRVFIRIDSKAFGEAFIGWAKQLDRLLPGRQISIDGKTLRRSHDHKLGALHVVNAWANDYRLVLGQVKTDDKSNEITAIPELLSLLCLENSIVTIDAIGTQRDIARYIVAEKADYVLALKENQAELYDETVCLFNSLTPADKHTQVYGDHGRVETRTCSVITAVDMLDRPQQWEGLTALICVEATREVKGQTSIQKRYYISSLNASAEQFNRIVRNHWAVENELHWVMDVAFNEDQCRKRKGNEAMNFAILRRFVLNLLRKDPDKRVGINNKRKRAGWDMEYLLGILELARE